MFTLVVLNMLFFTYFTLGSGTRFVNQMHVCLNSGHLLPLLARTFLPNGKMYHIIIIFDSLSSGRRITGASLRILIILFV